jgi:hypothetical protein
MEQWSEDKACKWYSEQPYFVGSNFYPSNAINQLEMWQEETFSPDLIEKELGYAKEMGMTIMRVYLHDLVWEEDSEAFLSRMGQYLSIADSKGIKTMFVFFDDCWKEDFSLGVQPDPIPYKHNSGWVQSPGVKVVNDPSAWGRLEKYVKGVLSHFKDDNRVAIWDLYNEPGNGTSGDTSNKKESQGLRSLPLVKKLFEWAREVNPSQPLTIAAWQFTDAITELQNYCLDNSDVISFHSYEPLKCFGKIGFVEKTDIVKRGNRPSICSEYLARPYGSTLEQNLRFMKKNNIGAINWGFVSGKTQTIYPWGWNESKGEPELYFHDLLNRDGSYLYPHEECVFTEVAAKLLKKNVTIPRVSQLTDLLD